MIECRTVWDIGDKVYMCNRCGGDVISEMWVFVEDGNTDDEQYVCATCAEEVAGGAVLGRLRITAAKAH